MVCGPSDTGKKTLIKSLCNLENNVFSSHLSPNAAGDGANDSFADFSNFSLSFCNNSTNFNTTNSASSANFLPDNILASDLQESAASTVVAEEVSRPPMTLNHHSIKLVDGESRNDTSTIDLKIVLSSGLGDAINNSSCGYELVSYLEKQHQQILDEECRIRRNAHHVDNRVHAVLYVLRPAATVGELDLAVMKAIGSRANLIPVVGKADLMTSDEKKHNKQQIMAQLAQHGVRVFSFAENDTDDSSESGSIDEYRPFAVVGANSIANSTQYRTYKWGQIEVDDPELCDLSLLRTVLLGSHIQELKDATHYELYEQYRTEKLLVNNSYRSE